MAVLRTYKDGVLVSEEVIEEVVEGAEEPPAEPAPVKP
jgi:hypothetical protein